MAAKKGNDFVIGVGLDTTALDKQVNSIFKKLEDQTKRLTAVENRLAVAKAKNNTLQMQEVGLAKRKLNLAKQVAAAEAKGITGLGRVKELSGGDKLSVAKAELALKEKMFEFDKKTASQASKTDNDRLVGLSKRRKAQDELRAYEEANRRNKKAGRTEAQAYAEDIRRMRNLHSQAIVENNRFDRNRARVTATRDPLGVSDRQKATLGSRIDYESKREYNTSLPEFSGPISRAKDQMQKLNKELQSASSVAQITNIRERFKDLNKEIREAVQGQNRLNRELNQGSLAGNKFGSSLKHMALQFASVYTVIEGARMAYRVGRDFDAMRAGLLAASSGAEEAKGNFEFLVKTAKRLGTDVEGGVRGFNRLGVAMKGAKFSPEDIKEVYTATQEAAATFQLTADKSNLVMLAMSQMASKGKISSEELTRQLGEHLPIAMQAAEKATGKTAAEVFKMMENGQLMAKDFLVPFAKALRGIVRENGALEKATEKLTSQQHRFTNALKLMVDQVFQDGMAEKLGGMFGDMAEGIEESTPAIVTMTRYFSELFELTWDGTKTLIVGFKELLGLADDLATKSVGVSLSDSIANQWDWFLVRWYDKLIIIADLIDKIKAFRISLGVSSTSLTQSPTRASTSGGRGSATTNTTTIGKIEVNSSKADPKAVASEVLSAMDIYGAQVGLF